MDTDEMFGMLGVSQHDWYIEAAVNIWQLCNLPDGVARAGKMGKREMWIDQIKSIDSPIGYSIRFFFMPEGNCSLSVCEMVCE